MATVTVTIPDAEYTNVRDAFCETYVYDDNKLDGETKDDFLARQTSDIVKSSYVSAKGRDAAVIARKTAETDAEQTTITGAVTKPR